jgi:cytochrome b pre-mRNA-processing protein 3
MILSLIRKDPAKEAATAFFASISEQARHPRFYEAMGVADSVDGRFELLILHTYLVLKRLKAKGREEERLSQRLADALFANLDDALREMGVGDLSVAKKIRRMAEGFRGRIAAYEKAMEREDDAELAAALARNVYESDDPSKAVQLASYVRRAVRSLDEQPAARLLAGIVSFVPPQETGEAP